MRRFFLRFATAMTFTVASAVTVLAADMPMPMYQAPPPAPAFYSWTGIYVGVHTGGAWSKQDWFYPCSAQNIPQPPCGRAQGSHTAESWLAGAQAGFNYQVGQWVGGIEADFSATRLNGTNLDIMFPIDALHSNTNFIGTVAPRLGLAWDRTLIYAKGGAAWAHDEYSLAIAQSDTTTVTADKTRWGWMVGLGVEYALANCWSAKIEYNYLDFGTQRFSMISNGAIPGQIPFDEDITQRVQVVKAGLNYKFDFGGPLNY